MPFSIEKAAQGGMVLGSNEYAEVTYASGNGFTCEVKYGPGETIKSDVTAGPVMFAFLSGVVFKND